MPDSTSLGTDADDANTAADSTWAHLVNFIVTVRLTLLATKTIYQ
jgi:heme/copper-type cytochrome/quinol oxidase subunit 4